MDVSEMGSGERAMKPFDDDDSIGTSQDALDLSPRQRTVASSQRRQRRPWLAIVVLFGVVVAGGVVLTQFLTSAIDYYCNVDEIDVKEGCEAGRRLRIQGVVDEGSVRDDGTATAFTVTFGAKTIPVRYEGDPGGIFKECIPVVVHGVISDGVFLGDRIEVKHSNEYEAANPDRVKPTGDGNGTSPSQGSECSPSV